MSGDATHFHVVYLISYLSSQPNQTLGYAVDLDLIGRIKENEEESFKNQDKSKYLLSTRLELATKRTWTKLQPWAILNTKRWRCLLAIVWNLKHQTMTLPVKLFFYGSETSTLKVEHEQLFSISEEGSSNDLWPITIIKNLMAIHQPQWYQICRRSEENKKTRCYILTIHRPIILSSNYNSSGVSKCMYF